MASTGIGTETGAIIAAPAIQKEPGLGNLRSIALPLALAAIVLVGWQARGHTRPHSAGHSALTYLDHQIHYRPL